jgi:hypothetical protein
LIAKSFSETLQKIGCRSARPIDCELGKDSNV